MNRPAVRSVRCGTCAFENNILKLPKCDAPSGAVGLLSANWGIPVFVSERLEPTAVYVEYVDGSIERIDGE